MSLGRSKHLISDITCSKKIGGYRSERNGSKVFLKVLNALGRFGLLTRQITGIVKMGKRKYREKRRNWRRKRRR